MLYLGMDMAPDVIYVPPVEGTITTFIELYGFAIPVEEWARFAAIDENGLIHIYEYEPSSEDEIEWLPNGGRVRYAGEAALDTSDNWLMTLVELNK